MTWWKRKSGYSKWMKWMINCQSNILYTMIHTIFVLGQTQKLGSLNVEMLKSICSHFGISFKSRDRKHQLIEKLAAMIAECSCEKSQGCWAHNQTVKKKIWWTENSCQCNRLFSLQESLMKLFQQFYCDPFGKKMFHLTTRRNSKGKRSDFLVCY